MRKVSIVDPHGFHLGDALSKLRGLADYAASTVTNSTGSSPSRR